MRDFVPPLDRALLELLRADSTGPVSEGLDWDALCGRASELGAAPMLHSRLRGRGGVPPEAAARLRREYLEAAAEAAHRETQLGPVLRMLGEIGVEVVVLKGAYLAEAAYESPALRRMGDVDLLVRAADVPRARETLLSDGFTQRPLTPFAREVVGRHHLVPFVREGERGITVELHDELTPHAVGVLDAEEAWRRSVPATVAGAAVRALCPEDCLVYLAAHACLQHRLNGGLAPLLDVEAVLRAFGDRLDGDALVGSAVAEGAAASVALLLAMAEGLLGVPVPAGAVARLAPEGVAPEVAALACSRLFRPSGDSPFVPRTFARLAHAGGVRRAAGVLLRRLGPGRRPAAAAGARGPVLRSRAARILDAAGLLWVFRGQALRLAAGCARERRAAAGIMQGEALALALAGDAAGRRNAAGRRASDEKGLV